MKSDKAVRTALVVDDNDTIRSLAVGIVERAGWVVHSESDPKRALELCKTIRFNVVLTDYEMPGMTGGELANRLHEEIPTGRAPEAIYVMTGNSDINMEVLGSNVSGIIYKPFITGPLTALFA